MIGVDSAVTVKAVQLGNGLKKMRTDKAIFHTYPDGRRMYR